MRLQENQGFEMALFMLASFMLASDSCCYTSCWCATTYSIKAGTEFWSKVQITWPAAGPLFGMFSLGAAQIFLFLSLMSSMAICRGKIFFFVVRWERCKGGVMLTAFKSRVDCTQRFTEVTHYEPSLQSQTPGVRAFISICSFHFLYLVQISGNFRAPEDTWRDHYPQYTEKTLFEYPRVFVPFCLPLTASFWNSHQIWARAHTGKASLHSHKSSCTTNVHRQAWLWDKPNVTTH